MKTNARKTIVVIPCYNEAARFSAPEFCRYLSESNSAHLLFVNDGSQDNTLEMLQGIVESMPERCSLLTLPKNRGKAGAVRQGVLHAFQHLDADSYVGYWDADLATPLGEIANFENVLNRHAEVEIVIGSRLPLSGHQVKRHWLRGKIGRCAALAASTVLKKRLVDTQCGAKLFRASSLLNSAFTIPFLSRWVFDVELLQRVLKFGNRQERLIYELPVDCWNVEVGSQIKWQDYIKSLFELWSILRIEKMLVAKFLEHSDNIEQALEGEIVAGFMKELSHGASEASDYRRLVA